jgi:5-methylcytosine-specific restriction protein A
LLAYAERLPLEPRARLLPEERLEALLLAGDEEAVTRLVRDEPAGIAEERRRYLMTEVVRRDRDLVDQLRDLYTGECQICGWAPRRSYGTELCESHQVRWLSRGAATRWGISCSSARTTPVLSTAAMRHSTLGTMLSFSPL